MSHGIYSALSGAMAQQRSLDITANNVANANTVGFRADRVAFDQALATAGARTAQPASLRYVVAERITTDTAPGALQTTGNPYDLALDGDGFFALATPQGERYTRAGAFTPGPDGVLRAADGVELMAVGDPTARIRIPNGARDVAIGADGTVSADGETIGRVRIVSFADPATVGKEGESRFMSVARPQAAPATTGVVQGAVEMSNVNPIAGLNELITTTRLFETFQRVIHTFADLDNRTARDLGSRNG
jgi:flagellar basal-body rod protein FlgF